MEDRLFWVAGFLCLNGPSRSMTGGTRKRGGEIRFESGTNQRKGHKKVGKPCLSPASHLLLDENGEFRAERKNA